jgi:hypothetical protein
MPVIKQRQTWSDPKFSRDTRDGQWRLLVKQLADWSPRVDITKLKPISVVYVEPLIFVDPKG